MALTIIDPDYIPSEAVRLTGLGIQTDPFATVLGGAASLYDFIRPDAPDSILGSGVSGGAPIQGLIAGEVPGVTGSDFSDINANKGLVFDSAKIMRLGPTTDVVNNPWNLRSHGDYASILMEHWLTLDVTPGTGTQDAVMGFAYQTSNNHQWGFILNQVTGVLTFRVNAGSQNIDVSALRGIPLHIVVAAQRVSPTATTFIARCWINEVLRATRPETAYPFFDATATDSSVRPSVGFAGGGFGTGFRGIYHRGGITKIPQDFSDAQIASWISERYSAINPILAI